MDRILTSGEIIDFMESRSIGPISGSAELFLLCQIAYELKLAREERERFAHGGLAPAGNYLVGQDVRSETIPSGAYLHNLNPAEPITSSVVRAEDVPGQQVLPARHPEAIVDKGKRRK